MTWRSSWSRRQERQADAREADAIWCAWRRACEGAGLCVRVETASGLTVVTPEVVQIVLGPPTVVMVRLLPGHLIRDVEQVADRLAPHLGAFGLRVERRGDVFARVELVPSDPLAGQVEDSTLPMQVPVLLGRDEQGRDLVRDWAGEAHMAIQGVTRSGKSRFVYGFLGQLASSPLVTVAGCDPTGLLWRPFTGSRHAPWQVSGFADIDAHEALLTRLVVDMDARIAALPADRDTIAVSEASPLRLVVFEELAGLYRATDAVSKDAGRRVRALIGRLLAEGAKAGYRVVLVVQRAEAALMGAFERAQCSVKVSFRSDNPAAVELLHPGAARDVAEAQVSALPGVGLLSVPGAPLTRFRAPHVGSYADYAEKIRAVSAGRGPLAA